MSDLKGVSVHSHSQKKNRSTSPKGKGKGEESEKEHVTVVIENIAHHRPRETSGKLLQFETSMISHFKAQGNLEQVGQSTMPMKGTLALRRKLPPGKDKHQILKESLHAIQTGSKNWRSPNAPPYDQRSAGWNEEQEEFARHKAYKLHKEQFRIKGHYSAVHKTDFFRRYVSTRAKSTAT